jgi:hypothetical protein
MAITMRTVGVVQLILLARFGLERQVGSSIRGILGIL